MNKLFIQIALVSLVGFSACTSDELPAPTPPSVCDTIDATYDGAVKAIIDSSCSYSGCHDGGGGIGPGNYTSYAGLQGIIQAGTFRARVIDLKDNAVSGMPPDNSIYPQSQKDNLTEEELEIIECWIAANYPEN